MLRSVLPSQLTLLTENSLANCLFSKKDILQIIRNLDSNKAHGHHMISIRMLKLCGGSICKPLELIFKTCLGNSRFLPEWKKANVSLFIRKAISKLSKTIAVSRLPIYFMTPCLMFCLRIIYFLQNNLNSDREILASINFFQLIMKSKLFHDRGRYHIETSPLICSANILQIFLDISKAFNKVWHDELIFELYQNGICDEMIISEEFLKDRKQRVVLNGQCLSCSDIHTGVVPQGSILGPLLFFIYINDLSNDVKSKCKLFADDTSLFPVVHDINTSANNLNHDLQKINEWAFQWK